MLGLTVFLSATVFAVAVAPADRTAYDAPEIPPTWTPTTRADPSAPITLHFLLHQPNIDALARHLDEVSDPSSKRLSPSAGEPSWTKCKIIRRRLSASSRHRITV